MINLKAVNQIFKGCNFQHAIIKKDKKEKVTGQPREKNLNIVMKCIKIHSQITQVEIAKTVAISISTVAACIKFLMKKGEVKKNFIESNAPFADRTFSATKTARLVH